MMACPPSGQIAIIILTFTFHRILAQELYMTNGTHVLKGSGPSQVGVLSIPDSFVERVVGLALDPVSLVVYFSDIEPSSRGIYRMNADGTGLKKIVADVKQVNGLTVDWVNKHLYWTDSERHVIEVSEVDGSNRRTLVYTGLSLPRGIVADPVSGYLFWNDQGTKLIERSNLDGSDRRIVVNSDIVWPNQMAVQPLQRKLFWVDAWTQTLNSVGFDGRDRTTVFDLSIAANKRVIFGLSLDATTAYISTWETGRVLTVALNGSASISTLYSGLGEENVFSLAVRVTDSAILQPAVTSPCIVNNYGCSHLCLPVVTSSTVNSARCTCPSFGAYTLDATGKICQAPSKVLIVTLADEGILGYRDLASDIYKDLQVIAFSPRPVAATFDPVDKFVYWSDVTEQTIRRSRLDGSGNEIFLNSSESIGAVDGMDIDLQSKRLYFSNVGHVVIDDAYFTWHRIEMIGLDGTGRKTVVNTAEKPRAVKIDTKNRYLYYSDWGANARIVRANLDGSLPTILRSGLFNPNGIFLSPNDATVYVVDSHFADGARNGSVYLTDVQGHTWAPVTSLNLHTPFDLAKDGGSLYVSDWGHQAILRLNTDNNNVDTFERNVGNPMALVVVVLTSPPTSRNVGPGSCKPTSCGSGSLCFSRPTPLSPVCSCSNYDLLVLDSSNRKSCKAPNSFILFPDMNSIKMQPLYALSQTTAQTLVTGSSDTANYVALTFDPQGQKIYFSDTNTRSILSANFDGSAVTEFYQPGHVIDGMTLVGQSLFWTDALNGSINSIPLIGGNGIHTTLVSNLDRPRGITVDNANIYWTEWGEVPKVMRSSLDGSNPKMLNSITMTWPNAVQINDGFLYLADGSGPKIKKINLQSGLPVQSFNVQSVKHIYGMVISRGKVYVSDWNTSTISVLEMDSKGVRDQRVLVKNLMRPTQIHIVDNGNRPETKNSKPRFLNCPNPDTPVTVSLLKGKNVTSLILEAVDGNGNYLRVVGAQRELGWSILKQTVTAEATDDSGQTVQCVFDVYVKDLEKPVLHGCPRDRHEYTSSTKGVTITWPTPRTTDNVQVEEVTSKPSQNTRFDIGSTTVRYEVKDASGNMDLSCTFTVVLEYRKDAERCAFPRQPNNGFLNISNSDQRYSVQWACRPGYAPDTNFTRGDSFSCVPSQGTWDPRIPEFFENKACLQIFPPEEYTKVYSVSISETCSPGDTGLSTSLTSQLQDGLRQAGLCSYQNSGRPFRLCEDSQIQVDCSGLNIKVAVKLQIISSSDGDVFRPYDFSVLDDLDRDILALLQGFEFNIPKFDPNSGQTDHNTTTLVRGTVVSGNVAQMRCGPFRKRFTIEGQTDNCVACPVGTRYVEEKKDCKDCESGTFQAYEGQGHCEGCPKGGVSLAGSFLPSMCMQGPRAAETTEREYTTVLVGVIAGVCVFLFILIVALVAVFVYRRHHQGATPSPASTASFENPAFKGLVEPHYESIPGSKNPPFLVDGSYVSLGQSADNSYVGFQSSGFSIGNENTKL